ESPAPSAIRCWSERRGFLARLSREKTFGNSEYRQFATSLYLAHITGGLVNKQWVKARKKAGLPEDLVLYCARHDFGTYMFQKAGNIAAVINSMGHSEVKTAMRYQRPELNVVRDAIYSRSWVIKRRPSPWAACQISASARRPVRPSSPTVWTSCVRARSSTAICRGRFSS